MNPFFHRNLDTKGFFPKSIIFEGIIWAQKRISKKQAGVEEVWPLLKMEKLWVPKFYNHLKLWLIEEKNAYFWIFWQIFKVKFGTEYWYLKNPLVQQFVGTKSFIWPSWYTLQKFLTKPTKTVCALYTWFIGWSLW